MPAVPTSVNAKIHPAVSELIMKSLAKDPAERPRTRGNWSKIFREMQRNRQEGCARCEEASRGGEPDG